MISTSFFFGLDRRRSVLPVGGTILKTLFGTATLADFIKLIVSVSLKTTNSYFDLYRKVILPQPIASNKHVRYFIDYTYFGIQHSKRDYLLLLENDYNLCYRGSFTICPSNVPIFSAQTKKFEMSLYFQTSNLPSVPQTTYLRSPSTSISYILDSVVLLLFNTPFCNLAMPKRQRTNLLQ